jgi:hypothetical protein
MAEPPSVTMVAARTRWPGGVDGVVAVVEPGDDEPGDEEPGDDEPGADDPVEGEVVEGSAASEL